MNSGSIHSNLVTAKSAWKWLKVNSFSGIGLILSISFSPYQGSGFFIYVYRTRLRNEKK
jgi:hypothetical protein